MFSLLWSITCLVIGQSIALSPLCDKSVIIDSTLVIDDNIYFFTDWTVTLVDMTSEKIIFVDNISRVFNFESYISQFRPPVEASYLHRVHILNPIHIVLIANVN